MAKAAKREVKIRCSGAGLIPLSKLVPTQGDLKSLSRSSYEKLKGLILAQGFSFPFHVWFGPDCNGDAHILDGHQRRLVLLEMRDREGYEVPDLPYDRIEASTQKEALEKLLAVASEFGKVDRQGLYAFIETNDIDLSFLKSNIELPNLDLDLFETEYYDGSPWQSDIGAKEKVDKVEPNLDGIISTIKINCQQQDKDAIIAAIRDALAEFDKVEIG